MLIQSRAVFRICWSTRATAASPGLVNKNVTVPDGSASDPVRRGTVTEGPASGAVAIS